MYLDALVLDLVTMSGTCLCMGPVFSVFSPKFPPKWWMLVAFHNLLLSIFSI